MPIMCLDFPAGCADRIMEPEPGARLFCAAKGFGYAPAGSSSSSQPGWPQLQEISVVSEASEQYWLQ
jgi:hypothetical protein